ncbi:MAG: transposase [Candidatus Accumulibacter sp.]|nr:transposase [Accumulibacter sp.]
MLLHEQLVGGQCPGQVWFHTARWLGRSASVRRVFEAPAGGGAKQPVFLIVDERPAHKAKRVQELVSVQQSKLKRFFLSPYSPQLSFCEYFMSLADVSLVHGPVCHVVPQLSER